MNDAVSREMEMWKGSLEDTDRRGGEYSRIMCVLFGFRAVRMLEKFKSRR